MLYFDTDYNNGLHPILLQRLAETNDVRSLGYGFDEFTESAKQKIRKASDCHDADVFLLVGGTQTNSTVIASMLHAVEGVVCADTGHINVHEAGAVEMTGHKVMTLPNHFGKLDAGELYMFLKDYAEDPTADHRVRPGMAYISFPTEQGTLYSAEEIDNIYQVCRQFNIYLFVDGARLGYALTSEKTDVSMAFLAHHCDVFYIGGTKVGALCGEAVVFPKGNAPRYFFSIVKQHGALLAKGRLAGVQFDALFTDGLYFRIAAHANKQAAQLRNIMTRHGFKPYNDSPTNQQFFVIPNDVIPLLQRDVMFETWGAYDETSTICRFVTSWATTDDELSAFSSLIHSYFDNHKK
ncbi:MAG: amino acid lyase [Prevotella sp.]|nr:amino acid lyase [Prevotella sp.]